MAIQTALCKDGGIMLIDEIEQSLESFRVKHAVTTFKRGGSAQLLLTTHSNHVLEELGAASLLKVKKGNSALRTFSDDFNGLVRSNPQAFFHERIIVCEGKTEMGFCRAIDLWLQKYRSISLALKGIGVVLGDGNESVSRCTKLAQSDFETVLFCDSDEKATNSAKDDLRALGVEIVDFDPGECIETAAFMSLPVQGVKDLLCLARDFRLQQDGIIASEAASRVWQSIRDKYGENCPDRLSESNLTKELRVAMGKAAKSKNAWFKSIDRGEMFGAVCLTHEPNIRGTSLGNALGKLVSWIENCNERD
jgi:putative ATP-dependent endonuclease of OLD family